MALVTIQRSPSPSTDPDLETADSSEDVSDGRSQIRKSLSESYFTVKGAALILPHNECNKKSVKKTHGGELQSHLQAMLHLLRPEDKIKIAVRLEDTVPTYHRYLAVVSTNGKQDTEEAVVLGMGCSGTEADIGLVMPVWMGLRLQLGGDGGFSLCMDELAYLFKPVSVQAMWSAIQHLVKVMHVAEDRKYIHDGLTHTWVGYYRSRIDHRDTAKTCQWNNEGVDTYAPSSLSINSDDENEQIKRVISQKLKEVMMTVDLDEATSIGLRKAVEAKMGISLTSLKSYFDEEVMRILGQMDEPSKILDFLYLGSEWNACNLEELKGKGIGYILNVTREIDNFFMGMFQYYNVRLYDVEESDLLKHWDKTYKFIAKARDHNSKVLVHCKMGISRSASTVMAYLMKENRWGVDEAYQFVKSRRSCVRPNEGFMEQLHMYEAILTASNKRDIFRCQSDQNLLDEPGKEEMDTSQGSFLGDSLFHVMSHSEWPTAAGSGAHEEEWMHQLHTGSVPNTDLMHIEADVETESRSADSIEEALPDMPSPPPTNQREVILTSADQSLSATLSSSSPPTGATVGLMEGGDRACGGLSFVDTAEGNMWLKQEGIDDAAYLSMQGGGGMSNAALGPSRIRPDSSWIRLDAVEDETSTDGPPKISEDGEEQTLPSGESSVACEILDDAVAPFGDGSASGGHGRVDADGRGLLFLQDATVTDSSDFSDDAKNKPDAHCEVTQTPTNLSPSSLHSAQVGQPSAFTKYVAEDSQHQQQQRRAEPSPRDASQLDPSAKIAGATKGGFLNTCQSLPHLQQATPISSVPPATSSAPHQLPAGRVARDKLPLGVTMSSSSSLSSHRPQFADPVLCGAGEEAVSKSGTHSPGEEEAGLATESDKPLLRKEGDKGEPLAEPPAGKIPLSKVELGVRQYFFREKIPWNPGRVRKMREEINTTGQIWGEDAEKGSPGSGEGSEEGSSGGGSGWLCPAGSEVSSDQALLEQLAEQPALTPLSQSQSCMELYVLPPAAEGEESCPLSLYQKEEIPLEPGTVLRTRLEIEERQRLFCGESDQEIFGTTRPVVRTASLKRDSESPRPRYCEQRRMTCGPIMSPLSGKSLDDLRPVGSADDNDISNFSFPVFRGFPGQAETTEGGERKTAEQMRESSCGQVLATSKEPDTTVPDQWSSMAGASESTIIEPGLVKKQTQELEQKCDLERSVTCAVPEGLSADQTMDGQHMAETTDTPRAIKGNFDDETLALIREIGSALLMSPTPQKSAQEDNEEEEDSCSNMVRYFVRKIEKQAKPSPVESSGSNALVDICGQKPSEIPSKEDALRLAQQRAVSTIGVAVSAHLSGQCAEHSGGFRMQDMSCGEGAFRSVGHVAMGDQASGTEGGFPISPGRSAVAGDEGRKLGAATTSPQSPGSGLHLPLDRMDEESLSSVSLTSSPMVSRAGHSSSEEPSVVRHLVGRFEIKSPDRMTPDFGQDYSLKHRDSAMDSSPCRGSPESQSDSSKTTSLYPTSDGSQFGSATGDLAGTESKSNKLFSTPMETGGEVPLHFQQSKFPGTSPPMSSVPPSVALGTSPLSVSSHMARQKHRTPEAQHTLRSAGAATKSSLAFDIAVELYELGDTPKTEGDAMTAEKIDDSDVALRQPVPTPFSKDGLMALEKKSWRPVRPQSGGGGHDSQRHSVSEGQFDPMGSLHGSSGDKRSGGQQLELYESPHGLEVDTTLRQVSDEGRKIRRLHGKSHPLTKLSQKRVGGGPFHSSM